MTEAAVRKRATLFMRELGAADAAAGLPPRESEEMRRLLIDFAARLGVGFAWTKMTCALNAYHPAHRRTLRDDTEAWNIGPCFRERIACVACHYEAVRRDAEGIAAHVGSIAHLARAEGAGAKARAT